MRNVLAVEDDPNILELLNIHLSDLDCTLEKAIEDCIEYDVRSTEVYAALDLLQKSCPNKWGFTLFREGLEQFDWNIRAQYLREGLFYIKKHTGYAP